MRRLLTLTLAIAAGACATIDADRDQVGNAYPASCPSSITSDPALAAKIVERVVAMPDGLLGLTQPMGAKYAVFLSDRLSGWRLEDVRRHEWCHVKEGQWHPLKPTPRLTMSKH